MSESGRLRLVDKVWVNEGGLANIFPLKQLEKLCCVTYDSLRGGNFVLHTAEGNITLWNNDKGMPYIDLSDPDEAEVALDLVQTIRGNMEGYSAREINEARSSREV